MLPVIAWFKQISGFFDWYRQMTAMSLHVAQISRVFCTARRHFSSGIRLPGCFVLLVSKNAG